MNDLIQRIEQDLTNGDTSIVIDPPAEHLTELKKRYSMKYKGELFGEVVWEVICKR